MTLPKITVAQGRFMREGARVVPFGPVYFARKPGTCGGAYFDDAWWPETLRHLERDFARMAEIGCNMVVPFVKTTNFFAEGRMVEPMFDRFAHLLDLAAQYGLYVFPLPNYPLTAFENVMGTPYLDDPAHPHKHTSVNPQIFAACLKHGLLWAQRFQAHPAYGASIASVGGRLWTGYAGYGPGEPEGTELLPVKPTWQRWLQERYADDFPAFLAANPRLPEQPKAWNEVALPVEVPGQFTEADSRTFDFLAFTATLATEALAEYSREVKRAVPGALIFSGAEGCEFERGPMEALIPGLADVDALWLEMYQFNMTHSSHTHPDWERAGFFEPTTNKQGIDMLSPLTEAWERTRYLKAAAPNAALICCHGTVMDNLVRWTPEPHDQRVIFERLHRTYLDAGADGLGFWCWTDDESSSRPEPEYFYREGEAMGIIDFGGAYRPVARRIAAYTRTATPTARVSRDVLLLLPQAHMMGLDRIDGLTTVACLTSALARLGVAPEVKATWFRGQGPIALEELTPFKLIVLGADEYRKDFPEVPETLCRYVEGGGRLLLAMGQPDTLLTPNLRELPNPALARLLGAPRVLATNHQHQTFWFSSVRWRLKDDFLPYWDRRRGRWMPGRAEKRLTFKWLQPPAEARVLAEACVPAPPPEGVAYGWADFAYAGENAFASLVYRYPLGQGAVYVLAYSLNVFRGHLDEIDVQRDDWDWLLQAAIDDANVATDPCHSLSVLAQEFLNFRPTR